MKMVTFGIFVGQQCYHHNPENKRHSMEVHVYSVLEYMLAKHVNCLFNVSHSHHACRTRSNTRTGKDAVRRYTSLIPANPRTSTLIGCTKQDECIRKCKNKIIHQKM